jgi:hypothetical protein
MDTYFTTSTAPPWQFSFSDKLNNVLNLTGATFTMTFRSVATGQKTRGTGTFSGTSQQLTAGQVVYQLSSSDLATAYAADSPSPGSITFELLVEATIGTLVYDAMNPPQINVRKV